MSNSRFRVSEAAPTAKHVCRAFERFDAGLISPDGRDLSGHDVGAFRYQSLRQFRDQGLRVQGFWGLWFGGLGFNSRLESQDLGLKGLLA